MEFTELYKFVISLPSRGDRRQVFRDQAINEAIGDYEFVPGVLNGAYQGKLRKEQYGCKFSHKTLIGSFVAADIPQGLVLEDDALFVEGIVNKFNEWIKEVPDDWDMIYLGAHNHKPLVMVSEHVGRCVYSLSTVGYIVRNTAYKLITELLEQDKVLDMIYALEVQPRLKCYCFKPNLVVQASGWSDIMKKHVDYEKLYNK